MLKAFISTFLLLFAATVAANGLNNQIDISCSAVLNPAVEVQVVTKKSLDANGVVITASPFRIIQSNLGLGSILPEMRKPGRKVLTVAEGMTDSHPDHGYSN